MHLRFKTLVCTVMAVCCLSATAGADASATRAVFSVVLSTQQPGAPAGLTLHILHRDPANPEGKPPAVVKNVIATPPGTRINDAAVTRCEATDSQFYAMGRSACPADSKVGEGTLTVVTGLDAPVDPVVNDVTLFNSQGHVIELVSARGTNTTEAVDRATLKDGTITAAPPPLPGGPPDGRTVIREIEFKFANVSGKGGSYVKTPTTCPESGDWTSVGTFSYADGYTESDPSQTPCSATTALAPDGKRPCSKSRRLTLRTPATGSAHIRRMEVIVNGTVLRRVPLASRRVSVNLENRPPGLYRVSVRATSRTGRRITYYRTVRICGGGSNS